MKRLKLQIASPRGKPIPGYFHKLIDLDSGQELESVRDITVNLPLRGLTTVTAELVVHEVEVVPVPE